MTTNAFAPKPPAPQAAIPALALRAEEAAAALGISPRTLWALKESGQIPYVKVGPKTHVFPVAALQDYLRQQQTTHQETPANHSKDATDE
jgi:excisionase family DNA binding protein